MAGVVRGGVSGSGLVAGAALLADDLETLLVTDNTDGLIIAKSVSSGRSLVDLTVVEISYLVVDESGVLFLS